MNNTRPPNDKPTKGSLLPQQVRQPFIIGMEIIDKGFMPNSFSFSPMEAQEERTRFPFRTAQRRSERVLLPYAIPRKTDTALKHCKPPPLLNTFTLLSPEYPATHAEKYMKIPEISAYDSDMSEIPEECPESLSPWLSRGDDESILLSSGPLLLSSSPESINSVTPVKDVPPVKGSQKDGQRSTEKNTKTQAKKMTSSTASSSQDVCTRNPQAPSKPVPRKTIGQRMQTRKISEVATTRLNDHKGPQKSKKAK